MSIENCIFVPRYAAIRNNRMTFLVRRDSRVRNELNGYNEIRFIMPFHEIVAIRSPLSICRGIAIREGKVEGRTRTVEQVQIDGRTLSSNATQVEVGI